MKRTFARKRFGNRTKQSLTWSDVSGTWTFAAQATTAATILIQLQSPTTLSNLTSDPPEDLTVLRVVGNYTLLLTGAAPACWTLALTVADVTWTPGADVAADNDKRLLWQKTYQASGTTTTQWGPPGWQITDAGNAFPAWESVVAIDIAPKVRIEPGKALYLVAYENLGAATLTMTSETMRVLYKRSGRR